MTAELLDGKAFLAHVQEGLRSRVAALVDRGVTPGLGTILVGVLCGPIAGALTGAGLVATLGRGLDPPA